MNLSPKSVRAFPFKVIQACTESVC